ncbi:Isoleucine--tRNA ligase, mitochondrial [Portunus trituberculatus]|uniref:Isoleucine--tRNA ligase, mitochondrial n=1 Tax=Portunus trituberculatus TaxID=210409 RepID=A0A5B7CIG2_PORTR|nr:Isoleucine--tRNA ligase, mitochondrial [Portunus trituberculatus]
MFARLNNEETKITHSGTRLLTPLYTCHREVPCPVRTADCPVSAVWLAVCCELCATRKQHRRIIGEHRDNTKCVSLLETATNNSDKLFKGTASAMPSTNVAAVFTRRSSRWKALGHTLHHRTLCNVKSGRRRGAEPSTQYSATVQLPRTSLPLRVSAANRAQLEASIQQAAGFDSLYAWQRGQNREKEFVLHDGPPYANGRPHIGHAVNKILKDITLRQKLLQGYKVHYIPGWDCHGLPIELKASQIDKKKKTPENQLSSDSATLEIRNNGK